MARRIKQGGAGGTGRAEQGLAKQSALGQPAQRSLPSSRAPTRWTGGVLSSPLQRPLELRFAHLGAPSDVATCRLFIQFVAGLAVCSRALLSGARCALGARRPLGAGRPRGARGTLGGGGTFGAGGALRTG